MKWSTFLVKSFNYLTVVTHWASRQQIANFILQKKLIFKLNEKLSHFFQIYYIHKSVA